MKAQKVVGAGWYMVALVPLVVGVAVAVVCFHGLTSAIEQAPRAVVPGVSEVVLEAGDLVAYGELQSIVRGKVYSTQSIALQCELIDPASGAALALEAPTGSTEYDLGAFVGRSMFTVRIPHAATYQLRCDGEGGPSTIAFLAHVGTMIVTAVLAVFAGAAGACVVAWLVLRRRKRARHAIAAARAAPKGDSP